MIEKYLEVYSTNIIKSCNSMFGVEYNLQLDDDFNLLFKKSKGLPNEQRFWVSISFHGTISGEYLLSIDQDEWKKIVKNLVDSDEDAEELAIPSIKEMLNSACGTAVNEIEKDFPDLTISSPRVITGHLDYPKIHTFSTFLVSEKYGQIELFLMLNLMKQGIGSKIDKALEQQASAMRELQKAENAFDALKQGILVMDSKGKIILGSAKKFSSLFFKEFKDITNKPLLEMIPPEVLNGDADSLLLWISNCFNIPGTMPWDDYLNLCPLKKEIEFNFESKKYIYKIQFHRIEEHKQLLMVVEDITKEKELLNQIQLEQEKNEMIAKIARDKNIFLELHDDIENFFRESLILPKEQENASFLEGMYRKLHTIKGGVLYFGFHAFIKEVHKLEDLIRSYRVDKEISQEEISKTFQHKIGELQNLYKNDILEIDKIIPQEERKKSQSKQIVIDQKIYDRVTKETLEYPKIKKNLEIKKFVENQFKKFNKQTFNHFFQTLKVNVEYLAEKFGKNVQIEFSGEELEFNLTPYQEILSSLIHIIRNSMDHGIEPRDIRLAKNKDINGRIFVTVSAEKEKLRIVISDDGAGISEDAVVKRAVNVGLIDEEEVGKMSNEQIYDLVFSHGFSTKDDSSLVSGRGVGLDAVKNAIIKLNGEILVKSKKDIGTEFQIELPLIDQ